MDGSLSPAFRIKRKPVPNRNTPPVVNYSPDDDVSPFVSSDTVSSPSSDESEYTGFLLEEIEQRFADIDFAERVFEGFSARRSQPRGSIFHEDVDPPRDERPVSEDSIHLVDDQPGQHEAVRNKHASTVPLVEKSYVSPNDEVLVRQGVKPWNPFWLQRVVLLVFCLLFALLFVALILLHYFAKQNHGLSTQVSSKHYAWTYGPTALLVIILTFWRQVDHCCRTLAPWNHLNSKAPVDADHSVLLDYLSPMLPITLWKAIQHRDWAVVASSLGTVILSIVIIFATGLLVLARTTWVWHDATISIDSKFDGSRYRASIDGIAALTYYGILNRDTEQPYGTTESVAFDTIDLGVSPRNSIISATANGFHPDFDCEVVPVNYSLVWNGTYDNANNDTDYVLSLFLDAQSSFCPPFPGRVNLCQPLSQACDSRIVRSSYSTVAEVSQGLPDGWNVSDPVCGNLWQISVADIRYSQTTGAYGNSVPDSSLTVGDWQVDVANISTIVCHPKYSVEPTRIAVNVERANSSGGVNVSPSRDKSIGTLEGFSFSNLSRQFSLEMSSGKVPIPSDFSLFSPGRLDSLLPTMMLENAQSSLDAFLDPFSLRDSANRVFQAVASLIALEYLTFPDHRLVPGTVDSTGLRLHVGVFSVWFMSVGFVVLMALTLTIVLFRPHNVVPRDPTTIGSQAAILASSGSLNHLLQKSGHLSDELLACRVSKAYYRWMIRNSGPETELAISISPPIGTSSPPVVSEKRRPIKWWRPLSFRLPFVLLALLLPAAIFIALEVLQDRFDVEDGIVTVHTDFFISHYLAAYISALAVLTAASLYDSINVTVAILAPYQSLRRGRVQAKRCLFSNRLGSTPLLGYADAVKQGHLSGILSSTTAVLGSLLVVITSGLYTIEPTADSTGFRLKQNNPSKIVLQVLLGIMIVCGIAIYALYDPRHTLPHNPCSIAGVMSLLAGSEMCDRSIIPPGAELMNDTALETVFAGWFFSLGWWNGPAKERTDSDIRDNCHHARADGFVRGSRFGIDVGRAEKSRGEAGRTVGILEKRGPEAAPTLPPIATRSLKRVRFIDHE